jgi:RNA polymerase sigma-70 factor, ECF subfamily
MAVRAPASRQSGEQAEERRLIEAAQKDPQRFADLYELHFELVYAYIVRRVGDRHTAEDLTSEVFYKAMAGLKQFEWRGVPFAAWLLRIASNAITDRAKRSAKEVLSADDPEEAAAPTRMEDIERQAQVFRLVQNLPEDQKNVIVLRFAEEKSIREIAQELGRSEGAIKQLQFRGVQNLREQLSQSQRVRSTAGEKKSGGSNA